MCSRLQEKFLCNESAMSLMLEQIPQVTTRFTARPRILSIPTITLVDHQADVATPSVLA